MQPAVSMDELIRQPRLDPPRPLPGSTASPGEEPSTSSDATIRDQLAAQGIILRRYTAGQQNNLLCPKCKGGSSSEPSFNVFITEDSREAKWICHRGTCGWAGGCSVTQGQPSSSGRQLCSEKDSRKAHALGSTLCCSQGPKPCDYHSAVCGSILLCNAAGRPALSTFSAGRNGAARTRKVEPPVKPDTSRLQPLSPELVAYFDARGISQATLARNGVMQDRSGTIAFPYTRGGEVVNIKFRTLDKKFRQVRRSALRTLLTSIPRMALQHLKQ